LLVIGYAAKICWVAMRVKAENRMVTFYIYYVKNVPTTVRKQEGHRAKI